MTDNPELYCYTSEHKFLLFKTIPFFILWGFIVPLMMFLASIKRKNAPKTEIKTELNEKLQ